ncbi:hypothetical protein AAC387_Pa01g1330 [Persea americana]
MAEIVESSNPNHLFLNIDDFYLDLMNEEEDPLPISDEKYALELQLQEVIMSSLESSPPLQSQQPQQQPLLLTYSSETTPTEPKTTIAPDMGESSASFCGICMDGKATQEMFTNSSCSHVFCSDCMSKHIAARIQENMVMVGCPEPKCNGLLEPEFCQSIIPSEVFERWGKALCESMVPGLQRFYCPFTDCAALLADDGGEVVRQSECPNCRRLFCAQCRVSWHSGIECEEYQKLNEDDRGRNDLMVMELAKNKGWKRCPSCQFYVERTQGCLHITCRCGVQFCYQCGATWSETHASCA